MSELPRVIEKGRLFKQKLAKGQNLTGAWSMLGSTRVAYIMARAGLDYLLIDLEHGSGDYDTLAEQIRGLLSLDTAVMVRLPNHDIGGIKRALDAGANALLFPMVDTPEQAAAIADAALYAPQGNRGVAIGAIAASDYGYLAPDYFKMANDALTILTQIESPNAVENVDQMVAVPGIDGFFVGPSDLSASLGVFRDFENPIFVSAFERVRTTVLAAGKYFAAMPFGATDTAALNALGAQIAPGAADVAILRAGAEAVAKSKLGGSY